MAKKKASGDIAGDTLVIYEPFVWNHHKWDKDTVGGIFICPADVPAPVFKGFIDDRLIGPEAARKIDEFDLMALVQKQMEAKASDDKTKFEHKAVQVTEAAIDGGGTVSSGEVTGDAKSFDDTVKEIEKEEKKMGWGKK